MAVDDGRGDFSDGRYYLVLEGLGGGWPQRCPACGVHLGREPGVEGWKGGHITRGVVNSDGTMASLDREWAYAGEPLSDQCVYCGNCGEPLS